jgi:catechol 2,3-dioxygenase-like lactoylglutathione lyase family enzyme
MLGDFLEVSLSTTEILASVEFYERLGFRHAPVGETWQHPYAVMSDGRVALGLHQYAFPSPALTFVVPGLRGKLGDFAEAGIEFAFCKTGDDEFNEAGFTDPDRQMIALLEARTYSPLRTDIGHSICGYFLEYRMGVKDCQVSRDFWERVGLVTASISPDQATYVQLARSGLNLGLQRRKSDSPPQLVFIHEQPGTLLSLLEARGIPFSRDTDHDAAALIRIETPDGLELLIRDRD